MNARLKELAVQAGGIWQGGYVEQANGDSVYTDKKFVSGGDMDVEQFARLLVKECMKVARGADGLDATHEAWYLIQEHFGLGLSTEDKKTLIKELLGVKND
jgi:hypothetical protein